MNPTALTEPTHSPSATPAAVAAASPPAAIERLQSLDAYRGLIMITLLAGSIFQSLKGQPAWNWLYLQNEHVEWEGCRYWDLIQPSFMFVVGVAMPFALARRAALGQSWARQFRHVLLRAFNLTLIGVFLDLFGAEKFQLGFMRVLQQIAIGYVFAFFVVGRSFRTQGLAAGAILVGYNLLWMFNPWNGPGGPWAKGNENIGSAFDMWLLGRYYSGFYVGMRLDDPHPPFLLLEHRGDGLQEMVVSARRGGHELHRRLRAGQRLRRLVPQREQCVDRVARSAIGDLVSGAPALPFPVRCVGRALLALPEKDFFQAVTCALLMANVTTPWERRDYPGAAGEVHFVTCRSDRQLLR